MSEKESFGHFARGVEPDVSANHSEAIQVAMNVRESIGEAVDALIKSMRNFGLDVDVCDGAYQVEADIYAWIKKANPGHSGFVIAEALGRAEQEGRASQPRDSATLTPYEQFLATAREVPDLSMFVPDVVKGRAGYLYDQGHYIEREADGKLYLRLGNQEFAEVPQANQRRLEAILYVWAVADGSRKDESKEYAAAAEAAHHICSFTTAEKRTRESLANLRELRLGVCHMQDIADAWPVLDKAAAEGADLNLAYELMCGLLALE